MGRSESNALFYTIFADVYWQTKRYSDRLRRTEVTTFCVIFGRSFLCKIWLSEVGIIR